MLDGIGSAAKTQQVPGVNGVGDQSSFVPSVPPSLDVSPAPTDIGEGPAGGVGTVPSQQVAGGQQSTISAATDTGMGLDVQPSVPDQPTESLEFKKGPFDEAPQETPVVEALSPAVGSAPAIAQATPPVADFLKVGQESISAEPDKADEAGVQIPSVLDASSTVGQTENDVGPVSMTKKQMLEAILRMQKDLLILQEAVVGISDNSDASF